MTQPDRIPAGTTDSPDFSREEIGLSTRNHGLPLEALRYPTTPAGLHYLIIHYDIPFVDPATWRLQVGGSVERPLSLRLEDLARRPAVTVPVTMECAGNGRARMRPRAVSQPWLLEAVGTGLWTGTPLRGLLEEAGVLSSAVDVVFTGLDRGIEGEIEQTYERSLTPAEASREEVLLAWALDGRPLPPQHGFPLRLVVPGWYGMAHVKWLDRITLVDEPFRGYQMSRAYNFRNDPEDPGRRVTRIAPRALMVPPGIPDFLTRRRFAKLGPCPIEGRAWSGWGPIESVELSDDSGRSWHTAAVEPPPAPFAWQRWSWEWRPMRSGDYELWSRARDSTGNVQPVETPWNLGGYAGNEVQRVAVRVV